jgi:hypothetical protein
VLPEDFINHGLQSLVSHAESLNAVDGALGELGWMDPDHSTALSLDS